MSLFVNGRRKSLPAASRTTSTYLPVRHLKHFPLSTTNHQLNNSLRTSSLSLSINGSHVFKCDTDHHNRTTSESNSHNRATTTPASPNLRHPPTSSRFTLALGALTQCLHSRHLCRNSTKQCSSHTCHLSLCTSKLSASATRLQRCGRRCTIPKEQDQESTS